MAKILMTTHRITLLTRHLRTTFLFVFLSLTVISFAQEKRKVFRDTTDNAFDISIWFLEFNGLLPVVIPITEPAVGYGAIGAAAFLTSKIDEEGKLKKPDIYGVAGGMTQNGTWIVGGMYQGYWFDDKIRSKFQGGYGDIHLTYYPIKPDAPAIEYSIGALAIMPQIQFRLVNSPFLLGIGYQYIDNKVSLGKLNDWIPTEDLKMTNSGLQGIIEFDKLDNNLTPTKGVLLHFDYVQNMEWIGSTRNFGKLNLYSHSYYPITERWIPALRVQTQYALGDVPFYSLPFIKLRGVPAMRYIGDMTLLGEMEHYVGLTNRWGLVGFGGFGATYEKTDNGPTHASNAWNAGAGFRYLLARLFGMKAGIDVARGPEDWAFYVTIGNGWFF